MIYDFFISFYIILSYYILPTDCVEGLVLVILELPCRLVLVIELPRR
jgi:hypothetical protein